MLRKIKGQIYKELKAFLINLLFIHKPNLVTMVSQSYYNKLKLLFAIDIQIMKEQSQ